MDALTLIWWITVGLAGWSLLALAVLIVVRAVRNRLRQWDAARRKKLRALALELLEHPQELGKVDKELRPRDRRLLLQVYDELLSLIRGDYAERLVSLMRILGLVDECLRQLRDRDWFVRAQACRMLGSFRDPNVALALYRAVEDPVPAVRVEAARGLVRAGAVRSVVDLVQHLAPGDELPSMPVLELFRSLGRKAVPELVGLIEGEHGLAAKVVGVDALGHLGDLAACSALLQLYDHPSLTLRMTSIEALGRLGDPRAMPAILLCMTDPAWEVRAQAAAAAGKIGIDEAVPVLQQLLRDDHWWVRYYAAEALFQVGDVGLIALRDVAVGDHPVASQMAMGLLQEKGVTA